MTMQPYANITGRDFTQDRKTSAQSVSSPPTAHGRYDRYTVKPETKVPEPRIPKKPEEAPRAIKPSRFTPVRLLVGFLCLTVLMILWVWETTNVREGLREVERLKDAKLQVEKTNEAIRTDITRLSGFQRIEKIATEHLRMVRAKDKPGVIFINVEEARMIREAR